MRQFSGCTILWVAIALIGLSAQALAAGPDVIVGGVAVSGTNGSNPTDYQNYGQVGSIRAYSFATTSCNIGTTALQWVDCTTGTNPACNDHPVIGQNLFRLKNGRFEQIGQSWLKHGFCALSQSLCNTCVPGPIGCDTLDVGCSDPYTASRNGQRGAYLGPKSEVNAATGEFPYPILLQSQSTNVTTCRLQVHVDDINPTLNAGALYFVEGQYVAADDAAWGNNHNNASYRRVSFNASYTINFLAPTVQQQPAIMAWAANQPGVQLHAVDVANDGRFWVGSAATDNGNGTWSYEYAIHNLNSDRSGQAFRIPIPASATITNVAFHDVAYHSGEPFAGTDWATTVGGGFVTWQSQTHAENVNANALRWGTLYNFRFVADVPPADNTATLVLFKPGEPAEVAAPVIGPSTTPTACACKGDANRDDVVDARDIQSFVDMFLGYLTVDNCADAAIPEDALLDAEDVDAFVALLLAGDACP